MTDKVEAAARAMFERKVDNARMLPNSFGPWKTWKDIDEASRCHWRSLATIAIAALAQPSPAQWQVPEGWQMVPKEPDIPMLEAGHATWKKIHKMTPDGNAIFYKSYLAALAAAPLPPATEE